MSSASAALLMDILFGRIRDEQAGWGRGMRRRLTGLLCCFWMGSALISFSLAAAERVDNSQNPSAGPRLVTIQEFLRQANDWGEMMLVTIRGTVTHSISDRTFFIQEAGVGTYVFHKPRTALNVGERVEVVGYPSLGSFSPTLQRCISVRSLGPGPTPEPSLVTPEDASRGEHHMSLVRVRGILSPERLRGGSVLVLRSETGSETFTADLEAISERSVMDYLQPGSVLELTGVSSVKRDANRQPVSFNVFLRSAADVMILRPPPWWTPRRMWSGLGIAAAALILVSAWVMTLQAQVRRQTSEIRQMNEQLERRVEMRTAQLTAANVELKAFGYSVSHDLRVPLRHISGFAGLLVQKQEAQQDPETRRYLELIGSSASRMSQLIDSLLTFSQLSRCPLARSTVSCAGLVEEVVREFQPDMTSRSIEWRIDTLPEVEADPSTLRLVWHNLLGNAIKYTRQRNPAVIAVSARLEGEEWVFSVGDNGAGFDMNFSGRLFGAFQRLHRDTEFEGTGIGLANVRRIIHRHSGRTWAEGEVDRGATFYFSLPSKPERGRLLAFDGEAEP
jgi:signal transduction histidine kinase